MRNIVENSRDRLNIGIINRYQCYLASRCVRRCFPLDELNGRQKRLRETSFARNCLSNLTICFVFLIITSDEIPNETMETTIFFFVCYNNSCNNYISQNTFSFSHSLSADIFKQNFQFIDNQELNRCFNLIK